MPIEFDASSSSDPDGDILTYRWDFDNDGICDYESSEPTATYTWDDDYTGTVALEVNDGEFTDTATTTLTVNNVAPVVDAIEIENTINENEIATVSGSINDLGLLDTFEVVIDWGDGTNAETFSYPAETTAFSETHQYLDDDPSSTQSDEYTVTVTVSDDDGGVDTASTIVRVNNVAPERISLSFPFEPISVNEPLTISSDYTDVGTLDTHTVTIDWGEGDSASDVSVSSLNADYSSHSYTSAGVYKISLTVTDDDQGSASITSDQYVVVYDSDGGFVTGGGWIESPEGAYFPDPALTGKATFGFVSKYKKGATVPTGSTEFQFKVADLNFHSDEYEWLVVAGSKAKYKGTGTINGEGNYGFMLTAIDAELTPSTEVDMFRIKIWDKDDGDAVVYDNMLGADEGEDPTTAIGGGAIKIHQTK
ncbi:PKD domain-containing protein [Methanococcoides orientis]|nr:PKD domain-containing protein [Methanococcoides orientis]